MGWRSRLELGHGRNRAAISLSPQTHLSCRSNGNCTQPLSMASASFQEANWFQEEVRLGPKENKFHQDRSFRVQSSVTIRVTCPWNHFLLLKPKSIFFPIEVSAQTMTFRWKSAHPALARSLAPQFCHNPFLTRRFDGNFFLCSVC